MPTRGASVSRPRSPRGAFGLFTLLVATIVSSGLRLPLRAADATLIVGEARVYKHIGDIALQLYVIRPAGWHAEDHRPAILFFHGGSWVGGTPAQFNEQATYFASRGLVCITVQYRLLPTKTDIPPVTCIQDARSAMRWVRSHAKELGIDPQRIASGGGSAGGHLAAHIGMVNGTDDPADDLTVSAKSNAMILFNPVLDNGPGGFGAERVRDRYPELSPAHNVSADDPPAILFLGSKDKLIPVKTFEELRAKMLKAGVRCELHVYEGEEHGFFNSKNQAGKYFTLTVREADKFLQSLGWLKGPDTLPGPAPTQ